MERLGRHLFARSALPPDDHWRVVERHRANLAEKRAHVGAARDDATARPRAFHFRAQSVHVIKLSILEGLFARSQMFHRVSTRNIGLLGASVNGDASRARLEPLPVAR